MTSVEVELGADDAGWEDAVLDAVDMLVAELLKVVLLEELVAVDVEDEATCVVATTDDGVMVDDTIDPSECPGIAIVEGVDFGVAHSNPGELRGLKELGLKRVACLQWLNVSWRALLRGKIKF